MPRWPERERCGAQHPTETASCELARHDFGTRHKGRTGSGREVRWWPEGEPAEVAPPDPIDVPVARKVEAVETAATPAVVSLDGYTFEQSDPPPRALSVGRLSAFLRVIEANPGRWYIYTTDCRSSGSSAFQRHPMIESTSRVNAGTSPKTWTVRARWIDKAAEATP